MPPHFDVGFGLLRFCVEHGIDQIALNAANHGRMGFHDPGFFAGNSGEVSSQKFGVIIINRRNGAAGRTDHICGVITPAKPDFDEGHICGAFGKGQIGGGGRGLKK